MKTIYTDVTLDTLKSKFMLATDSNGKIIEGTITIDTEANILATTATLGSLAWASDLGQLMIGDGTNWWLFSSYLNKDLSAPDMGILQNSNRQGYGSTYVTDKWLVNCRIGYGTITPAEGALRQNPLTHVLQIYQNSSWQTIVANFQFQEEAAYDYALECKPVGLTKWIRLYSGNSTDLGMNGLPIVQGYKVSMGAYPPIPNIDGGTF
jgi:hypothetical protein